MVFAAVWASFLAGLDNKHETVLAFAAAFPMFGCVFELIFGLLSHFSLSILFHISSSNSKYTI